MPDSLEKIVDDQLPECLHGFAYRMATFSDDSDDLFDRWEKLLLRASHAKGWCEEYAHWNQPNDHWAKGWDRFHQFLWLLQCYEYFSENNRDVSFPASKKEAKPDLRVTRPDGPDLYVECYFYTKWWDREWLLEVLLRALDRNLQVERTYNISFDPSGNPMSAKGTGAFLDALALVADNLTPTKLDALRAAAKKASPQLVCKIGDFLIELDGCGRYIAKDNAHGDPSGSWPVFEREIIAAKKDSNGLEKHRPNLVMVNGLGLDFQFSFDEQCQNSVLPKSLDAVWIYRCGIDKKVAACPRRELSGRRPAK